MDFYGDDNTEDYSGGSGNGGLLSNLFQTATQLGTVALEANANPANTAILNGQSVSSPGFSTSVPLSSQFGMSAGGSGMFFFLLLIAGGAFLFLRRK